VDVTYKLDPNTDGNTLIGALGHVNAEDWEGYPPQTVVLRGVRVETDQETGERTVLGTFQFREHGHNRRWCESKQQHLLVSPFLQYEKADFSSIKMLPGQLEFPVSSWVRQASGEPEISPEWL
jgi:hypothetical protein